MFILLSPSKTMDFSSPVPATDYTLPTFLQEASELAAMLRNMNTEELKTLMEISSQLAFQTKTRFSEWQAEHRPSNARQTIFAFAGDVYDGLNAGTLNKKELSFAQQHLIILSGLYGILKPLDLIMPFRLEMGVRWENEIFKSLYDFWKEKVNEYISEKMRSTGETTILNLASNEYFKILEVKKLNTRVIAPAFMEQSGEKLKMVSVFAKKARGMMARFVVRHNITNPVDITAFEEEGYFYSPVHSHEDKPVFVR
jgi:uncharacterized protein